MATNAICWEAAFICTVLTRRRCSILPASKHSWRTAAQCGVRSSEDVGSACSGRINIICVWVWRHLSDYIPYITMQREGPAHMPALLAPSPSSSTHSRHITIDCCWCGPHPPNHQAKENDVLQKCYLASLHRILLYTGWDSVLYSPSAQPRPVPAPTSPAGDIVSDFGPLPFPFPKAELVINFRRSRKSKNVRKRTSFDNHKKTTTSRESLNMVPAADTRDPEGLSKSGPRSPVPRNLAVYFFCSCLCPESFRFRAAATRQKDVATRLQQPPRGPRN